MADSLIDRLEAALGPAARLRVIANCGGQRRHIPLPRNAAASRLAAEVGADVAVWLADVAGGEQVDFPSPRGASVEAQAARLMASVIEAGLTDPSRSANDIAREHGVTVTRVRQVRRELRRDLPDPAAPGLFSPDDLPLSPPR